PTTTALIERLAVDKPLRHILGWERRAQVPSEATFSRAFAEFAQGDLPDKMHAALVERSLGGRIVCVNARAATEIEAREKPVKTEPNDKKQDPPPPDGAPPTRKRGRPRKDEQRPKPEPTRLERQTTQNLDQMLADLPTACCGEVHGFADGGVASPRSADDDFPDREAGVHHEVAVKSARQNRHTPA